MSINPKSMHLAAQSVQEKRRMETAVQIAKNKGFNVEVKKDGTIVFKMSK